MHTKSKYFRVITFRNVAALHTVLGLYVNPYKNQLKSLQNLYETMPPCLGSYSFRERYEDCHPNSLFFV